MINSTATDPSRALPPSGNIENDFKENVHPLNTRALAAEILGQPPPAAVLEGVDGPAVERVMRVLAAQPPRLTGRNATKVIAAHLLGERRQRSSHSRGLAAGLRLVL